MAAVALLENTIGLLFLFHDAHRYGDFSRPAFDITSAVQTTNQSKKNLRLISPGQGTVVRFVFVLRPYPCLGALFLKSKIPNSDQSGCTEPMTEFYSNKGMADITFIQMPHSVCCQTCIATKG